uniref:Uncharacterized protein n=1 Tax=Klebsiella pneumoniae TaxID=573 RepID=A0A486VFM9_KLEPN|nr:Uncharacterised protein [Klebsiella pneumoniae]
MVHYSTDFDFVIHAANAVDNGVDVTQGFQIATFRAKRDKYHVSHQHSVALNFGVETTSVDYDVIVTATKRSDVFDDVILDVGERDQLQLFIMPAVFTPSCRGALDVDISDLDFLFLFDFQTGCNLLSNSRFAWATLGAAHHNDLSHS